MNINLDLLNKLSNLLYQKDYFNLRIDQQQAVFDEICNHLGDL